MILPDVNVFLSAFIEEQSRHSEYRAWLDAVLDADQAFGVSDIVLSGFLRIATNPRALRKPAQLASALKFVEGVREHPNCVTVTPGDRHWSIFVSLCRKVEAKGTLIPDVFFAALAIESGCEWISADRDYARFPGLRWRHPLDGK